MKTPAFWYQKDSLLSRLLAPVGSLYRYGGRVRRHRAQAWRAKVPVICMGNITAGGAGKTPSCLAIVALIQKLSPHARPVFVTRGYGGRLKGPVRVDLETHSALDVGDEALLLARTAPCWVGRDRVGALQAAQKEASHIIVDDGLQNPFFAPTLSFLVVDGAAGFGNERLIPAGPLRERLQEALPRLDAALVIGMDRHKVGERIPLPLFKATARAVVPSSVHKDQAFLAFAGLARPAKFYASCREAGLTLGATKDFPDHHAFTGPELKALEAHALEKKLGLVTTEKDAVRIPPAFREKVHVIGLALDFEDDSLEDFLKTKLNL